MTQRADQPFFPEKRLTRFHALMELLRRFYAPSLTKAHGVHATLKVANDVLVEQVRLGNEDLELEIAGAMLEMWARERKHTEYRIARGSKTQAVKAARDFAAYFSRVIFADYAQGDRAILRHRFGPMASACETAYRDLLKEPNRPRDVILPELQTEKPSLLRELASRQRTWIRPHVWMTRESQLEALVLTEKQIMQDLSEPDVGRMMLVERLHEYWLHIFQAYPQRGIAYGDAAERRDLIGAFATCFYDDYFIGQLGGDRGSLMHDFPMFANGYWFALLELLLHEREEEQTDGE